MKKLLLTIILLNLGLFCMADSSFSMGIGSELIYGQKTYLNMTLAYINSLTDKNMELDFAVDLGLNSETTDNNGQVLPSFCIPINLGLNFTFPLPPSLNFLIGIGINPVIFINASESGTSQSFLAGPFLKAGTRVKVHENLKVFIEVQQNLLVGGSSLINNATRIVGGLNFSFAKQKKKAVPASSSLL